MIKNYTSNSKQTFDKIQKILSTHKAKSIFFEYDDEGKVKALAFSIQIKDKMVAFRLPAKVRNVAFIMYGSMYEGLGDKEKDQAYRTTWANIRDWLDAQMALIDTDQVKIEEVFLPYLMVGKDQTLFQKMEQNNLLLPSST